MFAISHSRLDTYSKCPYLYKLQYIDKKVVSEPKDYFVLGTLVHRTYEIHLSSDLSIKDSFNQAVEETIKGLGANESGPLQTLLDGHKQLAYLSSAECSDPKSWIRKPDGTLYSKPSMSNAWKSKLEELNLTSANKVVANWVKEHAPELVGLNIPEILSTAEKLVSQFSPPKWINCFDADMLEFPMSDIQETNGDSFLVNPVKLTETTNDKGEIDTIYFRGYIDFVAYTSTGQVIIGDHKTNDGPPPSQASVEAKPQLNRYAWAWREIHGKLPDMIAVHHVRSGKWVAASVNPTYVDMAYQDMLAMAKQIQQRSFYMRNPDEYNSPCWKCDMMSYCWPKVKLEGK